MRKGISLIIASLMISLLLITPAQASFGRSSLINIPIADGLKEEEVSLSYQYFNAASNNIINLEYGAADNLQLGINLKTDFVDKPQIYPSLQAKVLTEGDFLPALSLGVIDSSRYLVASQTIPYQDIRLHYGVGDEEYFSDYVFLGASKVLNPVSISTGDSAFQTPMTTLMLEYNSAFNLGVNLDFDSELELDFAGVDLFSSNRDFSFKLNFSNTF